MDTTVEFGPTVVFVATVEFGTTVEFLHDG